MSINLQRIDKVVIEGTRSYCVGRLESLRGYRLPWWSHWAQLAEVFLPRKYRWFISPNNYIRGTPMNQSIVDETGLLAARTCATGLLAGLTSPDKPWFSLGVFGIDDLPEGPARVWLAECTNRMLAVFGGSNFYTILGQVYHQDCVFGSAAMIQYEDQRDVIHFYNPCLGEFFFGLDDRLEVDTLYREFTYTIKETVDKFGLENVSEATKTAYKNPATLDTEIVVCHAIEPNNPMYVAGQAIGYIVPKNFKYREVYWEQTSASGQKAGFIVKAAGFHELPFGAFRWDVTSNDAYGSSPGMDGLPANRQLQIEQRRKAEAIDKMVRPPMIATVAMKNEPTDITPGGTTFVPTLDGNGFKPAYQVNPNIADLKEDLIEVQNRLKEVFFVDLFKIIQNLPTVRTATEIEALKGEQIIQLGPVIERTEAELDRTIQRTFAIMMRRGMFPPPPPELAGATVSIRYISMLAEAQRASSTAVIERFVQFVGGLVAVQPQAFDNVDTDQLIETYGEEIGVPPQLIRPLKQVAIIRAQRQQAQQAQAALQVGQAAASGAQTLSQTDVGGGQNALQAMLGQGGGNQQRAA